MTLGTTLRVTVCPRAVTSRRVSTCAGVLSAGLPAPLARTVELAYSHDTKHTHTNRFNIVDPGPGFGPLASRRCCRKVSVQVCRKVSSQGLKSASTPNHKPRGSWEPSTRHRRMRRRRPGGDGSSLPPWLGLGLGIFGDCVFESRESREEEESSKLSSR